MEMEYKIWISEHAYNRFIERVLIPNDLLLDKRFCSKCKICKFLKGLTNRALQLKTNDKQDPENYFIFWPNPNDPIVGLILVIEQKTGVVKTCWNINTFNPHIKIYRGDA